MLSASGSLINALLVVRLGIRRLIAVMPGVQILVSAALLGLDLGGVSGAGFWSLLVSCG